MSHFSPSTQQEIDKLGNAIIFLIDQSAYRSKKLSKTRILKLIYLIEEESIKKFGLPFFNLPFLAWHLGPVSEELYFELSEGLNKLGSYLNCEVDNACEDKVEKQANRYFKSIQKFDDGEFSDNEIALLEYVNNRYKAIPTDELIAITHAENSPWWTAAKDAGVLDQLERKIKYVSSVEIDFRKMLKDNPDKLKRYDNQIDFLETTESLKL